MRGCCCRHALAIAFQNGDVVTLKTYRSASEQIDLPIPDARRISEWPTALSKESHLAKIDPYSITIQQVRNSSRTFLPLSVEDMLDPARVESPKTVFVKGAGVVGLGNAFSATAAKERYGLSDHAPSRRFNVLTIGLGAPVASLALTVGSQARNGTHRGFEDLLILTTTRHDLNLPWDTFFPVELPPDQAMEVVLDSSITLDALVWSDIKTDFSDDLFAYFQHLASSARPKCPVFVTQLFPNVHIALEQFHDLIRSRPTAMHHAVEMSQALHDKMIGPSDASL